MTGNRPLSLMLRCLAALALVSVAIWQSPAFHAAMLDLFTRRGAAGHVIELHARINPEVIPSGLFIEGRMLEAQMLFAAALLVLPLLIWRLGYALPLGVLALVPILALLLRGSGGAGLIPVACIALAAMVLGLRVSRIPERAGAVALVVASVAMVWASPLRAGGMTPLIALAAPLPLLAVAALAFRFRNR